MACEYNSIVNNIENMLSKLSDNQKERDDVKPLIKWLNEAKVIGNSNETLNEDLSATKQNLKEPSTYTVYPKAKPDMVKAKYKASKQLNPKFKGKFILAHAGIGKSYAVQYNSNLIDGDDLFTESANEVVTKYNKSLNEDVQTIPDVSKMKSIFTAWGEYSTDTKKVQEAKKRREEVYQLYADKAQQLMKQGKTILSSSARPATIKIADYVIVQDNTELIKTNLQSDLRINKNSETDTNKIKEKINKFNQVALDNKIPLIKLSSQEFLSDILYSEDTTKSKPKDEAYVKQTKQQEISTESKLKQLLEVYSTGLAPKIGGGLVEDVTWWETRDEDKPKATMMKGTQEESLKDILPKIDVRKLNKYKTAVNAWYNENKRGSTIRETLNELLDILNSVEQEPRLAEEFGWDSNTNDNSPAYQKESSYKISMGDMLSAAADRNTTSNHIKTRIFMKDTLDNLKSLYPDIEYVSVDKLTDNGIKILGRAIGRVVEISKFDRVADTIPHEYAHVYIDVLEDTPAIKNVLKKIQNVHNLSIEEAKEFLAKHMGEFYVDKNIPKTVKEINLVRRLWEYILEVFKKITDKNAAEHFKLLDEITLLTTDFKTGKNKELFAENIKSFGVELQTDSVEEVPNDISYEDLVFYNSSNLSKYGTAENYKDYVKTIFPNSKVQDILAHDTGSSWMLDEKNNSFEDSWMFSEDVFIDGKGGNYGLVSGEGFYMYKPVEGRQWDNNAAYTGHMKINTLKPLNSSSSEYTNLDGKDYYSKMSKWTNTKLQSNPDSWYMLDNPPEKVTINSIVNKQKGYDSFINEVRPGLVEHVAWKNEQVHILGSKKDIEGFKAYMNYKEVTNVPKLSSNNTLLVPAEIDTKNYNIGDLNYKKEFHITALGFPQGKEITKMAETLELQDENGNTISIMDAINQLVTEADLSYKLTDKLYKISRDRETWKDWKDQSKGKVVIHEEAIIQLVEAEGIKKLVEDINSLLETNFPIPYPHISVATTEGSLGIGIADENAFNELNKIKLDNDTMKQDKPKQETAKMTANEIIEAAKECAKG